MLSLAGGHGSRPPSAPSVVPALRHGDKRVTFERVGVGRSRITVELTVPVGEEKQALALLADAQRHLSSALGTAREHTPIEEPEPAAGTTLVFEPDEARLRDLESVATPGPWRLDGPWWHDDKAVGLLTAGESRTAVVIAPCPDEEPNTHASLMQYRQFDADLEFIAAARTMVPELLSRLFALRERNERLVRAETRKNS